MPTHQRVLAFVQTEAHSLDYSRHIRWSDSVVRVKWAPLYPWPEDAAESTQQDGPLSHKSPLKFSVTANLRAPLSRTRDIKIPTLGRNRPTRPSATRARSRDQKSERSSLAGRTFQGNRTDLWGRDHDVCTKVNKHDGLFHHSGELCRAQGALPR